MGRRSADAFGGLQSVQNRHGDIHEDQLWFDLLNELHGFPAITGFTHDFDASNLFQCGSYSSPHDRMVISQKHSDMLHTTSSSSVSLRHFRGNQAWTSVPSDGAEINSRPPPASAARSSMLNRPRLEPRTASSRCSGTSK